MRVAPLALTAGLLIGAGIQAQTQQEPAPLEPARQLAPRAETTKQAPVILRARELRAHPDIDATATGEVEFRRAGTSITADQVDYDVADDLARALGHVRIVTDRATYTGPELQLKVQRFEGFFVAPEFQITAVGAGGRAERVEFLSSSRANAIHASYTSCPRVNPDGTPATDPDWVLQADRVQLDLDANEGLAEGAVLRFLGVPILAAPSMSFPLTDARKSGWLPPTVNYDSHSGFELMVPWYWNIAPQRDATIAPHLYTRRGLGLDGEFRYLEPTWKGQLRFDALPNDRVTGDERGLFAWRHEAETAGWRWNWDLLHVSDDTWWKDFPGTTGSLTPRLLGSKAALEREFAGGDGLVYARFQGWQVLQASDSLVTAPYQRAPQIGLHWSGAAGGFEFGIETEYNRFTLPGGDAADFDRQTGSRWHAVGEIAWPWREPGGWIVPRLSLNAASYRTDLPMADGRTDAQRIIPTASIDMGLEFERATSFFGRSVRQTLEPRLLYVNTPYRRQDLLPDFDAAAKDFNFDSIYSPNAFSGIDRVSDSHQITAGVTTRWVDEASGVEALRLGLVQRFLLRDQRVTPQADGTPDGEPLTRQFSDILLLASTHAVPSLSVDASVQYSTEVSGPVRSVVGLRWSPGPYRTLGATYRYTNGLAEQLELGWQWPVYTRKPAPQGSGCGGTWYSVGRMNYSLRDSRTSDAIVGVEYDAGCWIGRVVVERLSTGRTEATTRVQLQLELVGLSRLGSNALGALKDNIPGYRLLREERGTTPSE